MMLARIALSLVVLSFGTAQAAECRGSEGQTPAVQFNVTWTKSGPFKIGTQERWDVTQTGFGQTLTGQVDVTFNDSNFSATKVGMSDRNNCTYTGTVSGGSVSGTYNCPLNGGPFKFNLVCTQ